MATKHVTLPRELYVRCMTAGATTVQDLQKPTTVGDALSAAISSHGAELDPVLQGEAKAAECAVCLWIGLDPDKAVHWRHTDNGYDVYWVLRYDVKHSKHDNARLIWPIKKRHLLAQKQFDAFILVTGGQGQYDLRSWITKVDFQHTHHIATESDGLTPGTWFLPQRELNDIDTLPYYALLGAQWSMAA